MIKQFTFLDDTTKGLAYRKKYYVHMILDDDTEIDALIWSEHTPLGDKELHIETDDTHDHLLDDVKAYLISNNML